MTKHILLVDSKKSSLRLFSKIFDQDKSPFCCTAVENVGHAKEALTFLKPQILFISLDGEAIPSLELVQHVKRNVLLRRITVICYGEQIERYKNIARNYGADFTVHVPRTIEGVIRIVNHMVDLNLS